MPNEEHIQHVALYKYEKIERIYLKDIDHKNK